MKNHYEGWPRGWFVAAWSKDLAPGDVQPLEYFGKHLVLYRSEAGVARILDAHCPHLGAHLGHGGRVEGDAVVCPFHAWEFDGTGRCTRIPYADKIPNRARVDSWPVTEKNGVIFVWHDPHGGAPNWEVPTVDHLDNDRWTGWFTNHIEVRTHPREIVENVADKAHFPVVHRTEVDHFSNAYDGHTATQHTKGTAVPPGGGVDHFDITATYYGPGFQLSDMRGVLHSTLLLAHTPVRDGLLHLRFAVALKRAGPRTESFAAMYVDNLTRGFHEDIAIWEHKVFRERPQLSDADGPIGQLRRWYRSFYKPRPPAP